MHVISINFKVLTNVKYKTSLLLGALNGNVGANYYSEIS